MLPSIELGIGTGGAEWREKLPETDPWGGEQWWELSLVFGSRVMLACAGAVCVPSTAQPLLPNQGSIGFDSHQG